MARADRLAQWIARDLLAAEGAPRTPDSMASVMRVSYRLADAALQAVGELVREIAAELAGQSVAESRAAAERQLADFEMGPGVPTWHPEHSQNDF